MTMKMIQSLESEVEYTEIAESSAKTICKHCLSCAFKLLPEYRLCAAAYENLYAAYKLIVTLASHSAHAKDVFLNCDC